MANQSNQSNQSSYQKRRAEVLSLRSYVKRYEIQVCALKLGMKTALQCLEPGLIEEAKNVLIRGLNENESKNV